MIKSFKCKHTEELVKTGKTRRFNAIQRTAERKLQQLLSAEALKDLKSPPGNRLEPLSGDREGQHSIRINDQCGCVSAGQMKGRKTWRLLITTKEVAQWLL